MSGYGGAGGYGYNQGGGYGYPSAGYGGYPSQQGGGYPPVAYPPPSGYPPQAAYPGQHHSGMHPSLLHRVKCFWHGGLGPVMGAVAGYGAGHMMPPHNHGHGGYAAHGGGHYGGNGYGGHHHGKFGKHGGFNKWK
ncbi:unnamed protein product [Rhodiola kirilowii]